MWHNDSTPQPRSNFCSFVGSDVVSGVGCDVGFGAEFGAEFDVGCDVESVQRGRVFVVFAMAWRDVS